MSDAAVVIPAVSDVRWRESAWMVPRQYRVTAVYVLIKTSIQAASTRAHRRMKERHQVDTHHACSFER